MKENKHEDFDWAKDKNQKERHISDKEVVRGRGYTCIECGQEMVAKKSDLELRRHHFAHFAVDVVNKGKCTFSNETYRHKIAKDILQILKKIKVPPLYKYPPSDYDGKPNKLQDSKFIKAGRIEIQMQFYENKSGKICWGRNNNEEDDKTKYNLFEPDVSFFDASDNPILLIEIVATHDIDKDKLFKIQSLGIDTIKVKIPRGSKEEIENTFLTTNNTEWVYNYERESTEYIRIPKRSDDAVSSINQFQRRIVISGESYECKKARINNLIRKINGCLESEQFRNNQETTAKELQRVTENTERSKLQLRDLQEQYQREVEKEFESETIRIENEEREFDNSEEEFSNRFGELEERYITKAEQLKYSHDNYESPEQEEIDRIEEELGRLEIDGFTIGERTESFGIRRETLQRTISYLERERGNIEAEIIRVKEEELRISELYNEESEKFIADRDRIQQQFDRQTEELDRKFKTGDFEQISEDGKRIKEIANGGKLLDLIEQNNRQFDELRIAKEIIKSETWRDWDWS
jgi:hypothetical protein